MSEVGYIAHRQKMLHDPVLNAFSQDILADLITFGFRGYARRIKSVSLECCCRRTMRNGVLIRWKLVARLVPQIFCALSTFSQTCSLRVVVTVQVQ